MRIPRVYTPQSLAIGEELLLEPKASHHILKVLRMGEGRPLELFNGQGSSFAGNILKIEKKQALVSVLEEHDKSHQSPLDIELAIGLSKGDRLEWVLQKATELGVSKISLLLTSRCEVKLSNDRLEKKMASWQQIVIGACEQSQRNILPTLKSPTSLNTFIEQCAAEQKFVLHHRSSQSLDKLAAPKSVSLIIGPEGGLDDNEITLAQDNGFAPLTLGPRVLRTETAPLAALSIMQFLWGDLGSL